MQNDDVKKPIAEIKKNAFRLYIKGLNRHVWFAKDVQTVNKLLDIGILEDIFLLEIIDTGMAEVFRYRAGKHSGQRIFNN